MSSSHLGLLLCHQSWILAGENSTVGSWSLGKVNLVQIIVRFSTLNYSHSSLLIDSLLCRISVSHLRFWQILALSSMIAHNLLRMRLWILSLLVLISVWGVRIIALVSGVKISLRRYHHRWMNHLAVRSAHLNDIHLVSILASICPFRTNNSSLCVDLLRG